MSGVHRSARISDALATGQHCWYFCTQHPGTAGSGAASPKIEPDQSERCTSLRLLLRIRSCLATKERVTMIRSRPGLAAVLVVGLGVFAAKDLGRADSSVRSAEQTAVARFRTDDDIPQWNAVGGGSPTCAADLDRDRADVGQGHVAGGDAMIGCSTPSTTTCPGGRCTGSNEPRPTATPGRCRIRRGSHCRRRRSSGVSAAHGCHTTASPKRWRASRPRPLPLLRRQPGDR